MIDALTLDQMRAFIAVADSGSFRAGARRLSRVQSAVSHAVATMESELGVKLFDRSGYRPALTPEGRALLADARAILLKSESLRARARGLGEGVELGLSIAVDDIFPIMTVGRALTAMRGAYPSVGIRIGVAALGGPPVALQERRSTLAIMVGENFRDPHIEMEALPTSVTLVPVVAASHPLAARGRNGDPIRFFELDDHLQIVVADPTPWTGEKDFGVLSPTTWRVGSQDIKHTLILAGLGWGRLPLWLVARDLNEGRLVRFDVPALGREGESVLDSYLAHRLDEPLGPAARAFRKALLEQADRGGDISVPAADSRSRVS